MIRTLLARRWFGLVATVIALDIVLSWQSIQHFSDIQQKIQPYANAAVHWLKATGVELKP